MNTDAVMCIALTSRRPSCPLSFRAALPCEVIFRAVSERRPAAQTDGRRSSIGGDRGPRRYDLVVAGGEARPHAFGVSGGSCRDGPSLPRLDDLAFFRA